MTYLHFIKNIFQIQDKNITLYETASLPTLKPTVPSTIEGVLTYIPDHCPHCKSKGTVIKWGYKLICVHLGQFNTRPVQLRLKKQRFRCRHCSRTFIAETPLVNKHCSLSNPLKLAIKWLSGNWCWSEKS